MLNFIYYLSQINAFKEIASSTYFENIVNQANQTSIKKLIQDRSISHSGQAKQKEMAINYITYILISSPQHNIAMCYFYCILYFYFPKPITST